MPPPIVDTRAQQDGQAPFLLSPWLPLLTPGLSLAERIATIQLMHTCFAQFPHPARTIAMLQPQLDPVSPPPPMPGDTLIASVCVVATELVFLGIWLLLR